MRQEAEYRFYVINLNFFADNIGLELELEPEPKKGKRVEPELATLL